MDISEMSDQEKSVLLAKAMEWEVDQSYIVLPNDDNSNTRFLLSDLYEAPMSVAWRVLNWAWLVHDNESGMYSLKWTEWFSDIEDCVDFSMPPADAQRLWLDKILELAIEAGIIEEE